MQKINRLLLGMMVDHLDEFQWLMINDYPHLHALATTSGNEVW
jgi:hypothetical protein